MAQNNKRYFNTFFFEDPYIEEMDPETKLLYLAMILNPHNNFAGCYEISLRKLMSYTGLSEDKVRVGIQKLQEDRKILFSGSWVSLKNFIKNNELNPNMCKKSFEIMRTAPIENILFILADRDGNAEPWVSDFVDKVGKGINAAIDSKNRNALNYANKNGLTAPAVIPYEEFSIDIFTNTLLKPSQKQIKGNPSPYASPNPSFPLLEPSGEYEEEREIENEYEEEREREIGNHAKPFEKYTGPTIQQRPIQNPYDSISTYWNQKGNLPRALSSISCPDCGRLINIIAEYGEEYVKRSIDNLSEHFTEVEFRYRPKSINKFLLNSVNQWAEFTGWDEKEEPETHERISATRPIMEHIPDGEMANEEDVEALKTLFSGKKGI